MNCLFPGFAAKRFLIAHGMSPGKPAFVGDRGHTRSTHFPELLHPCQWGEERSLPGWPKKRLVKEVRRHLWHYGIRPSEFAIWQATWMGVGHRKIVLAHALADASEIAVASSHALSELSNGKFDKAAGSTSH